MVYPAHHARRRVVFANAGKPTSDDMRTRAQDSVSVRRATTADVAPVLALEQSSFDSDQLSPRQLKHHQRATSSDFWVAADANVLGYALVFYSRRHAVARLYSLAVAASARGRGVGRWLMAHVSDGARQRGARELRLEVRKSNTAAIALYESLGFQRFGERRNYYQDGEDAWRFRLPL